MKTPEFYIVVTNYEDPSRTRIITHAYGSLEGWSKKKATNEKFKIIREHRKYYPGKAAFLRVSICKLHDIELLNRNIIRVETDNGNPPKKEPQGPHQGPSGEVLI